MMFQFKSMFWGVACFCVSVCAQAQTTSPAQHIRVLDAQNPTEHPQKTWVATLTIDESGNAIITRTEDKPIKNDQRWSLVVVDELGKWKNEIDLTTNAVSIITEPKMDYWLVPMNPSAGEAVKLSGSVLNLDCACDKGFLPMVSVQYIVCATQNLKRRCSNLQMTTLGASLKQISTNKSAYLLVKAKSIIFK